MAKGKESKSLERKNKKREASPDKSNENIQENQLNEELAALKIDLGSLLKIREELQNIPVKEKVPDVPVLVKKVQSAPDRERKSVKVAKLVESSAPLKPLENSPLAGPQYDLRGNLILQSLLGTEEDYLTERRRRNLPNDNLSHRPASPVEDRVDIKIVQDPVKPQHRTMFDTTTSLKHWNKCMDERKSQQAHLSIDASPNPTNTAGTMNRPTRDLVMNQSVNYRSNQETKEAIDRTLGYISDGKGYRTGTEFWNQPTVYGTEETGIIETLSQSKKGFAPPLEHIGVPRPVQLEKGVMGYNNPIQGRAGWQDGEFLEKRKKQLKEILEEIDPHRPNFEDLNELYVKGNDKPSLTKAHTELTGPIVFMETPRSETLQDESMSEYMDIAPGDHMQFVNGPALRINGIPARWEGENPDREQQVGLAARVVLQCFEGEQTMANLEFVNYGSTVIHFKWNYHKQFNPFGRPMKTGIQNFYFNTGPGVILPRQRLLFPFVFKSTHPGLFTDRWELTTSPTLCGGAKIIITLRGIAFQIDRFAEDRKEIEKKLELQKVETTILDTLWGIVDSLQPSERPLTPVDEFITKEEKFERLNPNLCGSNEKLIELNNFYIDLFPEGQRSEVEWDLSMAAMQNKILQIDEDRLREKYLKRLNDIAYKLTTPQDRPSQRQELYNVGYSHLCSMIDGMVGLEMHLRQVMGIPDIEFVMPPDMFEKPQGAAIKSKEKEEQKRRQKAMEGADKKESKKGKDKGKKERPGSKKKDDKRRSKSPKDLQKDSSSVIPTDSQVENEIIIIYITLPINKPTTLSATDNFEESRIDLDGEDNEELVATMNNFQERLHIMVSQHIGQSLGCMFEAFDEIRSRNPWNPNLPT